MHSFGVVIPGAPIQPRNSGAGNSPPLILGAWDMQCRGPKWVAEGALQGREIRALTHGRLMVLWAC